jgi:hypothetical protein
MQKNLPTSYRWFLTLGLTNFVPWEFVWLDKYVLINERFVIETALPTRVATFASHQGMDTFAGFEIIGEELTEKVIVFHPTFQTNVAGWNIIEARYVDIFAFVRERVLPDMQEWLQDEDVNLFCL